MVLKNLSRVLLLMVAGSLSYQVSAARKYPASDFQPKIVYQSEETQRISNPPKAQSSEAPPIAQLIIVLLIGGLGAYVYKNKYQKTEAVFSASADRPARGATVVKAEPREPSDRIPAKRINRNYKGYRSKRLS